MTKTKRLRAGWFVALIYLLCVLAPTLSFALPGSQAVAPCLIDASHVLGILHVHTELPTQHVHTDSRGHDHASMISAPEDFHIRAAGQRHLHLDEKVTASDCGNSYRLYLQMLLAVKHSSHHVVIHYDHLCG